jgi:putative transport protein
VVVLAIVRRRICAVDGHRLAVVRIRLSMIDAIGSLLGDAPLLALFITVAVGHLVGKLRVGSFVLGGVTGTLVVGVAIGQFGVSLSDDLRTMFFALFIYALGYEGGPQFVRSLNRRSLKELASALTMALLGLLVVLGCALAFDLDPGTAAGLGAGGLTSSATIGTADEAITELPGVTSEQVDDLQTNVAVGYAITYFLGQVGSILAVTWLIPRVMRWDLRREARAKAQRMSAGVPLLEPGQVDAVERLQTRFFRITGSSELAGDTIGEIDAQLSTAAVEAVVREGTTLGPAPDLVVDTGDIVALTGDVERLESFAPLHGTEVAVPRGLHLVEERRDVVITNADVVGRTFADLRDRIDVETRRGILPRRLTRMGREVPLLADLELHRGDEVQLVGRPSDLDRVEPVLGYEVTAATVTDYVFFGLGIALGVAIGLLSVTVGEVPITLGTGGGCLVAGLFVGWLRSTHPRYAALPTDVSDFLRDFGLAVFVGIVGLTAGPRAIESVQDNGAEVVLLGVAVSMLPILFGFPLSYVAFRIRDPVDVLACMAGGRHSTPALAGLLEQAGNRTPVAAFTITYAVATVLLTAWGPLIISLVPTTTGSP